MPSRIESFKPWPKPCNKRKIQVPFDLGSVNRLGVDLKLRLGGLFSRCFSMMIAPKPVLGWVASSARIGLFQA